MIILHTTSQYVCLSVFFKTCGRIFREFRDDIPLMKQQSIKLRDAHRTKSQK